MTDLDLMFRNRADRTDLDPDVDAMIADAVAEGLHLARRRRRYAAAGSSAVVVGAVAALVVVLTPSSAPEGAPPAGEPSPTTSPTASPAGEPARLVRAAPSKFPAPMSLGLLPAGWRYSGGTNGYAAYAANDDPRARVYSTFEDKIVVNAYESADKLKRSDFPLVVGDYPARYETSDGTQFVSLFIRGSITVDFQIAKSAHLTRSQALEMASSVTIRNLNNPAHG